MRLMQQLVGSAIPMFANMAIFLYVCQRFIAATRLRRKIMTEMRKFATIVRRARENLGYIGERVAKGMDEIRDDVGKELRVTDRLTTQSAKLAAVLERFASHEENVIELVRMDRNRESVKIETPTNVTEEIERIVAAARRRNAERQEHGTDGERSDGAAAAAATTTEDGRDSFQRNPASKFSTYGPREANPTVVSGATRKPADGRARIATTPEVRLLGETPCRPPGTAPAESKR